MFSPELILKNAVSATPAPSDLAVVFCGREQLVRDGALPAFADLKDIDASQAILAGAFPDGRRIFGIELPALPETAEKALSRAIMAVSDADMQNGIARAREMAFWYRRHRLCGTCGKPMVPGTSDLAMVCQDCKNMYYPQVAPAVIVAITRNKGKEILLAHNRNFGAVYSLIAGFVETGESAEQAVHREIKEEIGISVKNIKYMTSQTWPYPHSLMLGFTAEYDSGNIVPDGAEIDDAKWFQAGALPELPAPGSVARRILNTLGF